MAALARLIDPKASNPYRRAKQARRGPVSEAENRIAWKVLGEAMRNLRRK